MLKTAKKLVFLILPFICTFGASGADEFTVFEPGITTSTNMCTVGNLGTSTTEKPSTAVAALWCSWSGGENDEIRVENGTCTFSGDDFGTCSYTTECDDGWFIADTNLTGKTYVSHPNKTTAGSDMCKQCTKGREYTITYVDGAEASGTDSQQVTYFGNFKTRTVSTTDLDFKKDNAKFMGWTCSGDGCGGDVDAFHDADREYIYNKAPGDITLTAIWACDAGFYLTSAAKCLDVGTGYYSPEYDNERYSCRVETASIYIDSDGTRATKDDCYVTLTAGKYIKTAGDATTTVCAAGSYCPGGTDVHYHTAGGIESCPRGAFCEEGVSNYTACVSGSYQDAQGQSECKACQNGKTTPVLSGNLLGQVGATECSVDCANNTNVASWTNNAEWTTENKVNNLCTALTCSAGSYFKVATGIATATATETANLCELCPIGSYNDTVTGASENGTDGQCEVCSGGKITVATGSTTVDACVEACGNKTDVATWTGTSWDSTNNSVKNLCTVSTCNAGSFLVGDVVGTNYSKKCRECIVGAYCLGGTANYNVCPEGAYQDENHQSVCKTCDKGKTTSGTAVENHDASADCSVSCPEILHRDTWEQPTWNMTTHSVNDLCSVATCETLGATQTVSSFDGVPSTDKKSCVYTGNCADGYNDESATCSGEDCICSANTININWDENYGNPIDDSSCTYGQTISFPQSNGRDGYEFNGWMIQQ